MSKLNIIYDARRHEKYEPLIKEMNEQGIDDYEIWPCLLLPDVVQSINSSHKMLVNYAVDNKLPEICIAEDDVMFTKPGAWDYFLKNKPHPDDYDLYLAATYTPEDPPKQICGFHLYFVSSRFYEKFLTVPDFEHIDTAINDLKGDYVFCYPFPALQRPGFSANNKMQVNYNKTLREQDIYK